MSHLVTRKVYFPFNPASPHLFKNQLLFSGKPNPFEQVPQVDAFTRKQLVEETQQANTITEQIVQEIAQQLKPGMTESQGRKVAKSVLEAYKAKGVVKQWHPPVMYFGENTRLSIADKAPETEQTLKETDIVYIDIGPVVELNGKKVEGDIGRTFALGNNPLFQALQDYSKKLFEKGVAFWRNHQPTGDELYQYLHKEAEKDGYVFNLEEAGHLIGSFPHHYSWRQALSQYPYIPQSGVWILEVQVRHPQQPYGAFYEAILQ